jgi:hypothetical protein
MPFRAIILLIFMGLAACTKRPPSDILSSDKMTSIITDIQLANVAYKMELLPESYKNNPEKYYLEILEENQTDSATYNRSLQYYAENPKLLKVIYMGVEKNIQQAK